MRAFLKVNKLFKIVTVTVGAKMSILLLNNCIKKNMVSTTRVTVNTRVIKILTVMGTSEGCLVLILLKYLM
jgi:hypothetical protein